MDHGDRIEDALKAALVRVTADRCPPKLASALDYALFPGGARVRPRLCLAVAAACGDDAPQLADAAASSIELLHCASLIHDDLPCFDDAETRRGKPSVHRAYGEPLAVLAGDALIVAAFETLGLGIAIDCRRSAGLISIVARAVGGPTGIVAGQAWECEDSIPMDEYHQAKTGSLFSAATMAGALAAGAEPEQWRTLGERLGESYQIADDICDLVADPGERGKPIGRDRDLGRPNAAGALGVSGALGRLRALLEEAVASVPDCPGKAALSEHILTSAQPYLPKQISRVAA
ncbi:MAG: polyprenyl synthetase family protein [Hyphomicrobiaceae bacterium]|nr:polyprenyl synthetase family protein [Hyphomicrobiaceae bacterium]